jgi:hypothetical protein
MFSDRSFGQRNLYRRSVCQLHAKALCEANITVFSGEGAPEEDGPIEPSKPSNEVRQEPYPLPKDFEWSFVDIGDEAQVYLDFSLRISLSLLGMQLRELYELLSGHYVEDDDATFRFQYSAEFLEWYAYDLQS